MGNFGSLYNLWALISPSEDGSFPQWPYNKETESKVTVSPSGHRVLWPSVVEMSPLLSQAGAVPFSVPAVPVMGKVVGTWILTVLNDVSYLAAVVTIQ